MSSLPQPASPEDLPPARSYRGESAEVRRQQRRERMLEAAFEAFAQHGITRTTMRDICSLARLTDRYFYESFRNTEDAFDQVYKWQKDLLIAQVNAAVVDAKLNITDMARNGLRAFYTFIQADPRRAQVLLIDAFSANQQSRDKTSQAISQYVTLIDAVARRLYPRIKRDFNMEMMTWGLLGMAIQVGTVWAQGGFKEPVDEVLTYNLYAWQGLDQWVQAMVAAKT